MEANETSVARCCPLKLRKCWGKTVVVVVFKGQHSKSIMGQKRLKYDVFNC